MKSLLPAIFIVAIAMMPGQVMAGDVKHEEPAMPNMEGMSPGAHEHGTAEGMQHGTAEGMQHGAAEDIQHGAAVTCDAPAHLSAEAEAKPGGGDYKGPLPKQAMEMGKKSMGAARVSSDNPAANLKDIAEMAGAHNMHKGLRRGEFFMVPNQLHHIEVVYSLDCGYQVFFYNAFTELIRADRFHAFMLVLPEDGDNFFEILRFLTPSADGTHLVSRISHSDEGAKPKSIFETELYIKFPESIEPMMFEVIVGTEVTWE